MSAANQAVEIVQAAYAAFGRGDVEGILKLVARDVDWRFCGSKGLPYTGQFRGKDEIRKWFISIPEVDEVLAFEPREFIAEGENVTVLGWERTRARPSGKVFECEWVHVFTVRNGVVERFWGMYDTEVSATARK